MASSPSQQGPAFGSNEQPHTGFGQRQSISPNRGGFGQTPSSPNPMGMGYGGNADATPMNNNANGQQGATSSTYTPNRAYQSVRVDTADIRQGGGGAGGDGSARGRGGSEEENANDMDASKGPAQPQERR